MKLRGKDDLGTIGRCILATILAYLVLMYGGAVSLLIWADGLSLSQVWDKYSLLEMSLPLYAAFWLGTPMGLFFAFIILVFEVDI